MVVNSCGITRRWVCLALRGAGENLFITSSYEDTRSNIDAGIRRLHYEGGVLALNAQKALSSGITQLTALLGRQLHWQHSLCYIGRRHHLRLQHRRRQNRVELHGGNGAWHDFVS
jgi:hypothetical protein